MYSEEQKQQIFDNICELIINGKSLRFALNEVSIPYNEEKDITFYVDKPTAYTKIYPGQFVIYFPEDGHAPGIGQGVIRKGIVKVLL